MPSDPVEDLIQKMRSGTLAQVRKELKKVYRKDPTLFNTLCKFYETIINQRKPPKK